jgi:hypothetical protein
MKASAKKPRIFSPNPEGLKLNVAKILQAARHGTSVQKEDVKLSSEPTTSKPFSSDGKRTTTSPYVQSLLDPYDTSCDGLPARLESTTSTPRRASGIGLAAKPQVITESRAESEEQLKSPAKDSIEYFKKLPLDTNESVLTDADDESNGERENAEISWNYVLTLESLSTQEKLLVIIFLVATLYVNCQSWTLESVAANTHQVFASLLEYPYRLPPELSSIDWANVFMSVVIGVALALTWDYHPSYSDAFLSSLRCRLLTQAQTGYARTIEWHNEISRHVHHSIQSLHRVLASIPKVLRYMIAIAMAIAVLRWLLSCTISVLVHGAMVIWPYIATFLALSLALIIIVLLLQRWVACRNAKRLAAQSVLQAVQSLLVLKTEPYVVAYLYLDLQDGLRRAHAASADSTPGKTRAEVVGTGAAFLDTPRLTAYTIPTAPAALLAICQDVDMQGLALAQVWPLVLQAVHGDKRIQSVELLVDGKRQLCWRRLEGRPSDSFMSVFSTNN